MNRLAAFHVYRCWSREEKNKNQSKSSLIIITIDKHSDSIVYKIIALPVQCVFSFSILDFHYFQTQKSHRAQNVLQFRFIKANWISVINVNALFCCCQLEIMQEKITQNRVAAFILLWKEFGCKSCINNTHCSFVRSIQYSVFGSLKC